MRRAAAQGLCLWCWFGQHRGGLLAPRKGRGTAKVAYSVSRMSAYRSLRSCCSNASAAEVRMRSRNSAAYRLALVTRICSHAPIVQPGFHGSAFDFQTRWSLPSFEIKSPGTGAAPTGRGPGPRGTGEPLRTRGVRAIRARRTAASSPRSENTGRRMRCHNSSDGLWRMLRRPTASRNQSIGP